MSQEKRMGSGFYSKELRPKDAGLKEKDGEHVVDVTGELQKLEEEKKLKEEKTKALKKIIKELFDGALMIDTDPKLKGDDEELNNRLEKIAVYINSVINMNWKWSKEEDVMRILYESEAVAKAKDNLTIREILLRVGSKQIVKFARES
jgi:hypothetical protein